MKKEMNTKDEIIFWIILGVVIAGFIGLIALSISSFNDFFIEKRLKKEGIVIDAEIIDRDYSSGNVKNPGSYRLTYFYKVKDENNKLQTYERGTTVTSKLYYSGQLGEKIKVMYLKNRPNVSRIVGNDSGFWGLILISGLDLFIIIVFAYVFREQYLLKQ